jgi:hypothetical protein
VKASLLLALNLAARQHLCINVIAQLLHIHVIGAHGYAFQLKATAGSAHERGPALSYDMKIQR